MPDILCIGKINVDYILGKSCIGGSATNTAIALAKLGLKVGLIGKIGNTHNSKEILEEIKNKNIDISQVTVAETDTGVHHIEVDNYSKKTVYAPGANVLLKPENISDGFLQNFKNIHVCSISYNVAKRTVELAEKHKKIFSIDPGYMLSNLLFEDMAPLLNKCRFFFPTENEIKTLTKIDNLNEAINKVLSAGVENLILKKKKSVEFFGKNENFQTLIPNVKILDPTGIGDNFAAGFLYSSINGKSYRESVKFGITLGNKAAQTIGGCYY